MQRRIALLLVPLLLLPGCIGLDDDPPAQTATSDDVAPASTRDGDAPAATTEPSPGTNATTTSAPATGANASSASTGATTTASPANDPAPPEPRVDVLRWNATTTSAGLGAVEPQPGLCCAFVAAPGEGFTEFAVPEGVKGIVVELTWADTTIDLDLRVHASDYGPGDPEGGSLTTGHAWGNSEGAPGTPDGHVTIAITDEEALALAGTWTWEAVAKGAAQATPFEVAVSLFLDEAPPADYAAPDAA